MLIPIKEKEGIKMQEITDFLNQLNQEHLSTHAAYEDLFWRFNMGDHSVKEDKNAAEADRNTFRTNSEYAHQVKVFLEVAKGDQKLSLEHWRRFFSCYKAPKELAELRAQIAKLENDIEGRWANREEGYIDPHTSTFVKASRGQMRTMMQVNDDEAVRQACFEAVDKLAVQFVDELIELVNMRNQYARALGYEDFYAYKLAIGEGMTKEELFSLFDQIYEATKFGFSKIRQLEERMPGLRKPWNKDYMLSGSFKQQRDPYCQFVDCLPRFGRSFAALGVSFQGGTMRLDLVEREGKHDNGFCHWPRLVHFQNGKRIPGESNFTCNLVPGQVGSGDLAGKTLFHEGGHSVHILNVENAETCMNTEYVPLSAAWAETQAMFFENMYASPEWWDRYAKDADGNSFPFSVYEAQCQSEQPKKPLQFMHYIAVVDFERQLYTTPDLTKDMVLRMARKNGAKYYDLSVQHHLILQISHMYEWESSCYYQSYGLAELAVAQWRFYFYEKYGYIVDNPEIGPEMYKVWQHGACYSFKEFVKMATGRELSPNAYLGEITSSLHEQLTITKDRIATLATKPEYVGPISLDGHFMMVHGEEVIADSAQSFEAMAESFRRWYLSLEAEKAAEAA